MDSGGKRGSQKSCANMKIMTPINTPVSRHEAFYYDVVDLKQTFCSTERPLSAISYWIRSLYPRSFCLKQKAIYNSCMYANYI